MVKIIIHFMCVVYYSTNNKEYNDKQNTKTTNSVSKVTNDNGLKSVYKNDTKLTRK